MTNTLSSREEEVLQLIIAEHTSKEIAEKLCVSNETVRSHRKNIRRKFQVRNVAGLVRRAFEFNLYSFGESGYSAPLIKNFAVLIFSCFLMESLTAQQLEISNGAKIEGRVTVTDTLMFGDSSTLTTAHFSRLSDGDGDTRIELEQGRDDDVIRFVSDGVEMARIDRLNFFVEHGNKSLHMGQLAGRISTGSDNTFVGPFAGQANTDGNHNTFLGKNAGSNHSTGSSNTYLGHIAGRDPSSGDQNTYVGAMAGGFSNGGSKNTFIGYSAGTESDGTDNTFIGFNAGYENGNGVGNTYLGAGAGAGANGNHNVFIGFEAGEAVNDNNKLVIANGSSAAPLISGEFDSRRLEFEADLDLLGDLKVSESIEVDRTVESEGDMITNGDLWIAETGTGDTNTGIKIAEDAVEEFGITYQSAQFPHPNRLHLRRYSSGAPVDIMTLTGQSRVGIGTTTPTTKLHVKSAEILGHVMKIENTNGSVEADGLEIKIETQLPTKGNNFITFTDANGVAGRIEGFAGESDLIPPPNIDFSLYYSPVQIQAGFNPGALPNLNINLPDLDLTFPELSLTLPQLALTMPILSYDPPSLSGGVASFSVSTMANCVLSGGINCGNPLTWNSIDWDNGDLSWTPGSFNWTPGSFNWTPGQLDWTPGSVNYTTGVLPSFDVDVLIDPTPIAAASDNLKDLMCWALENGERSFLTTNPWDLTMHALTKFTSDLAKCKAGGVTYGSGGADYAEYLERENHEEDMQNGQIVGVRGGKVSLNTEGAEQLLVISSMPIVLGNIPRDVETLDHYEKVAFLGQAPVWVVGKVRSGDYIIPSGHHDGLGLAVAPAELTIDKLPLVIGRAWSDSDQSVSQVNMVLGLKTNEMSMLMQQFQTDLSGVEERLARIEMMLEVH